MTYNEVVQVIKRCLLKGGMKEDSIEPYCEAAGMPRAAACAAERLWIQDIHVDEDSDTEELKRQLLSLKNTGIFAIDD